MKDIQVPLPLNYMTKQLMPPVSGAQLSHSMYMDSNLLRNQAWYDMPSINIVYPVRFASSSVNMLDLSSKTLASVGVWDCDSTRSPYSDFKNYAKEQQFDMQMRLPNVADLSVSKGEVQTHTGSYTR